MALKAIYEKQDDIPEQFRELYTERDGKWELSGIEGVKTQADVDRVQSALTKERNDHKDTKEKLKKFDGIDPEQVAETQTKLDELQAKVDAGAGGTFDEAKFNEAVEKVAAARVKTATAPLERDLGKLREENGTLTEQVTTFKQRETTRTITDAVRKAAVGAKVIESAQDDILLLAERVFEVTEDGAVVTRDGVGVTPGIQADIWLGEMQDKRPHWWPQSTGGGAGGGGGGAGFPNNPFSHEHWNMTEQGKVHREDAARAERMAKAAGTTIGGPRPIPRQQQQVQQPTR